MTGLDLILAALAAGMGIGTSDATKAAVLDAYTGLRNAIRKRLAGRAQSLQVLDAVQYEPDKWQTDLVRELELSEADKDDELVAAAHRVLALTDPDGTAAGKYRIHAGQSHQVHIGDTTISAPDNQGAVGTFHGPVNIGGPPVPPTQPGAI